MTTADLQQRRIELAAALAAEDEHFLRHGEREYYLLDGEKVDYAGWRTVTQDRLNQAELACQLEGGEVQITVPGG